jgi:hypothetical protein
MINLSSEARPHLNLANKAWPRVRPRCEKIVDRDGAGNIAARSGKFYYDKYSCRWRSRIYRGAHMP